MLNPFEDIPTGRLESLNILQSQFTNDISPDKVDLMCGVYQNEEGQPFVLPSVRLAKKKIFDNPNWNHEYPSSHLGEKKFRDLSATLLFGNDAVVVQDDWSVLKILNFLLSEQVLIPGGSVASMQTLGGSGACHMGAAFLKRHYRPKEIDQSAKVYVPAESWGKDNVNLPNVFRHEGFETASLPYYNNDIHHLDASALDVALRKIPSKSIIALQVCGNNPTGCDPSSSQWDILIKTFLSRQHFAFLDVSYMGFVSGDVETDCEPIRKFAKAGIPLLVAATYGKAFGLYGERVGCLHVTAPTVAISRRIETQMKLLARAETGAQPRFGALIFSTILENSWLKGVWQADVQEISRQLQDRRVSLKQALKDLGSHRNWDFITQQKGMFLYVTGVYPFG
ncbi:MAG: hypothetical protein Q9191_000168 [Dirinaria sp. TL-2023a]